MPIPLVQANPSCYIARDIRTYTRTSRSTSGAFPMPLLIAFFNQKGGTAKTTSTLNVAAALAEKGRRVLMVDLDPQASLTMAVGADIASMDGSVYDVLLDETVDVQSVITGTTISSVALLPAHPDLAAAELELLSVMERERVLAHRLETLDLS